MRWPCGIRRRPIPRAEFGHAEPRARFDECSYSSEFFLAKDTLVSEVFAIDECPFPITAVSPTGIGIPVPPKPVSASRHDCGDSNPREESQNHRTSEQRTRKLHGAGVPSQNSFWPANTWAAAGRGLPLPWATVGLVWQHSTRRVHGKIGPFSAVFQPQTGSDRVGPKNTPPALSTPDSSAADRCDPADFSGFDEKE